MPETKVKTKSKKPKVAKSDPISVRMSPDAARILDRGAVELFEGNRAKAVEHCIRYAFAGLDAPKPPRNRLGTMPRP